MSPLADAANLAVAALNLKLVQDVIGAMRAADAAVQGGKQPSLSPAPIRDQARHIHPDPIYCKPLVIHPDAVYEKQRVIHVDPRFEVRLGLAPLDTTSAPHSTCKPRGIKPVWSVLPWQEPAKPSARVKVVQYRTDILHKGSLIDMFI